MLKQMVLFIIALNVLTSGVECSDFDDIFNSMSFRSLDTNKCPNNLRQRIVQAKTQVAALDSDVHSQQLIDVFEEIMAITGEHQQHELRLRFATPYTLEKNKASKKRLCDSLKTFLCKEGPAVQAQTVFDILERFEIDLSTDSYAQLTLLDAVIDYQVCVCDGLPAGVKACALNAIKQRFCEYVAGGLDFNRSYTAQDFIDSGRHETAKLPDDFVGTYAQALLFVSKSHKDCRSRMKAFETCGATITDAEQYLEDCYVYWSHKETGKDIQTIQEERVAE